MTQADLDHEQPRWAKDSNTFLYFTHSDTGGQGTLWESTMLGGVPRYLAKSLGGGDISHDDQRIAAFQLVDGVPKLVIIRRDGSPLGDVVQLTTGVGGRTPRWAPNDQSIAYLQTAGVAFTHTLVVVPAAGGQPNHVDDGKGMKGLAWVPDGSGLVYGSALAAPCLSAHVSAPSQTTPRRATAVLTFDDEGSPIPTCTTQERCMLLRPRSDRRSGECP